MRTCSEIEVPVAPRTTWCPKRLRPWQSSLFLHPVYEEALLVATHSLFLHHTTTLTHRKAVACTRVLPITEENLFLCCKEFTGALPAVTHSLFLFFIHFLPHREAALCTRVLSMPETSSYTTGSSRVLCPWQHTASSYSPLAEVKEDDIEAHTH